MTFIDNAKADIRLQNFSIYAQWLSMLALIASWLAELASFITFSLQACPPESWCDKPTSLSWIISLLRLTFFPIPLLAIDLPHFIKRFPFLYISLISFLVPVILQWQETSSENPFTSKNPRAHLRGPTSMITFALVCGMSLFVFTSPQPGVVQRIGLDIVYWHLYGPLITIQAIAAIGPYWIFLLAATIYVVAWSRGDEWVSSRVLGGSGVEAMRLMIPGTGPRYQFIGEESGEGRIQLV